MKRCVALAVLLLFSLSGCCFFLNDFEEPAALVARETGMELPRCAVIQATDTHGGFLGDGDTLIILHFEGEARERLERELADAWEALPLPQSLYEVVYEHRNLVPIPTDSAEEGFPQITGGYWYFDDRQSESNDPAALLSRNSCNFTLALYDCDTARLYYIEVDT